MGLREDIATGTKTLAAWLLDDPADAELWPDERQRLFSVVDHIDGLDRRPPEQGALHTVRVQTQGGRGFEYIQRRWTGRSSVKIRSKATGRQLVRYARWTLAIIDALPVRGVSVPDEVLETAASLRDSSDAAATIVSLRGEVL